MFTMRRIVGHRLEQQREFLLARDPVGGEQINLDLLIAGQDAPQHGLGGLPRGIASGTTSCCVRPRASARSTFACRVSLICVPSSAVTARPVRVSVTGLRRV